MDRRPYLSSGIAFITSNSRRAWLALCRRPSSLDTWVFSATARSLYSPRLDSLLRSPSFAISTVASNATELWLLLSLCEPRPPRQALGRGGAESYTDRLTAKRERERKRVWGDDCQEWKQERAEEPHSHTYIDAEIDKRYWLLPRKLLLCSRHCRVCRVWQCMASVAMEQAEVVGRRFTSYTIFKIMSH